MQEKQLNGQRKIWKNGLFLNEDQAVVSVYDSAFMYSDSTFTMLRTFNRDIFRLDAHLDRLLDGARYLHLPLRYNFHQLRMAHEDIVMANRGGINDDDEFRLFTNISRGPLPIYDEILKPEPWVMITAYPLRWFLRGYSQFYKHGRPAVFVAQPAIPSRYQENSVKHHCRMSMRIAERQAQAVHRDAWPLLVDDRGAITESTGANFFIVKRERLITPEPRNCLSGISRNQILRLARKYGIPYRERDISPYEAVTAQEAFFTGTPFSILPCASIDKHHFINGGRIGNVTKFLTEKWEEEVDCSFREQAEKWDQ